MHVVEVVKKKKVFSMTSILPTFTKPYLCFRILSYFNFANWAEFPWIQMSKLGSVSVCFPIDLSDTMEIAQN